MSHVINKMNDYGTFTNKQTNPEDKKTTQSKAKNDNYHSKGYNNKTKLEEEEGNAISSNTTDFSEFYENLQIIVLTFMWYGFNVMYNLDNKLTLQMLPLPWIVSVVQLFIGWIFFMPLWMFKFWQFPTFKSFEAFTITFVPLGILHLFVHIGAVISMELGAVSFTHIVKAAEPVTTCLISGLFGDTLSWQTYLTLIPVTFGVALASVEELSFTWISFGCAMLSNIGSSGRVTFTKKVMKDSNSIGTFLTTGNQYAIITIVATVLSIPLAILVEGPKFHDTWEKATGSDSPFTASYILYKLLCSATWYHLYNLVAFFCLERVNPITHSVINTLKRVVIVISSIIFFKTSYTLLGAVGSAVAILGTFLYSATKTKYH